MGEIERRNEVAVKGRKHVISLKFKERKNDLSQFTPSKTDQIEKEKKKTLHVPRERSARQRHLYAMPRSVCFAQPEPSIRFSRSPHCGVQLSCGTGSEKHRFAKAE